MEQVFIFETDKGNVAVGSASLEALKTKTIEQIAQENVPSGKTYYIVDSSSLPSNAAFFNSWVFTVPPAVEISLNKAKVQYKETADSQAAILSQPLTQEYMRLMAIGGDTTAVQAQLQAINAAAEETAYLDAASVDALIACWPPELGPNPFLPASTAE